MATSFTTPNAIYYQQLLADVNSKTPVKGLEGTLGSMYASTAGLAGIQASTITQQLRSTQAQVTLKNAYTTMLAGYTKAQLGLKGQALGITQLAAQEKGGLLGVQTGVEQQQFQLGQQVYPEEQALAALTNQNKIKGLQEQTATSGAQNTTTQKRALATQAERYGFQQADIARAQQTSLLAQQATAAKQTYTAQQIANTQKNIGLLAQANGLSQQEVMTRLNYAITQNQITGVTSVSQLMTKLSGVWAGEQAQIGTKLSTTGFASGINLLAPSKAAPVASGGKVPTAGNVAFGNLTTKDTTSSTQTPYALAGGY